MQKLSESFEWSRGIEGLPQERLLKVIAKTTAPTIHPEDPTFPVRVFAETELMKNARSLIGRAVGRNHEQMPIYGAYAVDADWNELEKQLEAILFVPSEYVHKVAEGIIKNASIEYTWRDTKQTEAGTEFIGLGITRVDLVEGLPAGDPNAVVSLFESSEKRGVVLAEIEPPVEPIVAAVVFIVKCIACGHTFESRSNPEKEDVICPKCGSKCELYHGDTPPEDLKIEAKKRGEPFAGYTNFADCVAKNQDKEDPEAYCASIQQQAETAPRTDAERAKAHFNISDEEWAALSEEEKQAYIAKLPPRGAAPATVGAEQIAAGDATRAKSYFKISDADWEALTEEEKRAYIARLPSKEEPPVTARTEQISEEDSARAKAYFNISDEEWEKLTEEEKKAYIAKLPPETPPAAKAPALEATIIRLSRQVAALEKSRGSAIENARIEARRELAQKVEAVIPHNIMSVRRTSNAGLIRLSREIRKVLRDGSEPPS